MIYVMSDIHGELDKFERMLKKIDLRPEDTLYVIGDVVDRGPHPIGVLSVMMCYPNIIPIMGNHELMALRSLDQLEDRVTDEFLNTLSVDDYHNLQNWILCGGSSTIKEFQRLNQEERGVVLDYLEDFSSYEVVNTANTEYYLIHAGFRNFSRKKALYEYEITDLVWTRTNYDEMYYPDRIVITGHTPTQNIKGNPNPGYIYRNANNIAIDCGACFDGGRLGTLCLDTGEEFYID